MINRKRSDNVIRVPSLPIHYLYKLSTAGYRLSVFVKNRIYLLTKKGL